MLDDFSNSLSSTDSARFVVKKQINNPICDKTPILHCACSKVRDCDHIHLWQRKFAIKRLFIKFQCLGRELERKSPILNILIWGSIYSDWNPKFVCLNIIELANDEGEQICRH